MIFYKKYKQQKEQTNQVLFFFKEFGEGKITSEDFWKSYLSNPEYAQLLKDNMSEVYSFRYLFEDYEKYSKLDINSMKLRIHLYWMIKRFLEIKKIDFKPFHPEEEKYLLYSEIIPNWIDVDVSIVDKLLHSAAKNLSRDQLIKACKCELIKDYKFRTKPPRWLQNPEWPIANGLPLTFIRQDGNPSNLRYCKYFDKINYTFLNEKTGETYIITQYD